MCNCYYCRKWMEHPPVDHWVVPGIRAAVKCDGCGRVFEVWAAEL